MILRVTQLESRLTPVVTNPLAVGSAVGQPSAASFIDHPTGQVKFTVSPFGDFGGGTRVAVGDVTGDGVADLIAAAAAGGGPRVCVYDGTTGQPVAGPLGSFFAFGESFSGGVEIAVGDVNADGFDDIIAAAGAGGGPHVVVFSGKNGAVLHSFYAYAESFTGGVFVAAGDVNGDGRADVVTGAGANGGPHVKAFSGATGKEVFSRFAYAESFTGGVRVAAADFDGDGSAEIVTGAGFGGGPHVTVIDPRTGAELRSFFAAAPSFTGGVRVLAGDATGDGMAEVLAVSGGALTTFAAGSDSPTWTQPIGVGGSVGEFCACPAVPQSDATVDWNRGILQAVREQRLSPPAASRVMAIAHLALFDAANGVTGEFQPYLASLPAAPAGADAELAASAAIHRVLSALLPAQQPRWDRLLGGARAGVDSAAASEAFGRAVGDAYLAARAADGSAAVVPYTPTGAAGDWAPTPPAFAAALLPGWGNVTPFGVNTGGQFAPPPPPALDSAEYAAAFNEVKALGSRTSAARTTDQSQIATFWADGAGTVTPPGHWNQIAAQLCLTDGKSFTAHARTFALLNAAMADAAITAWFTKYRDDLWRPVTAIRRAGEDGNPATTADPAWESFIATPPFPAYTSGHSTFSAAAAAVLAAEYGTVAVRTPSDALPDVSRTFPTFAAAAAEAGQSRIYGGIHYQFDNTGGLTSGTQIGEWVTARLLRPA